MKYILMKLLVDIILRIKLIKKYWVKLIIDYENGNTYMIIKLVKIMHKLTMVTIIVTKDRK